MKIIIASPGGVVLYNKLRRKLGRKIIDSLIEHNILHLRPTNRWLFDIGPVVTAKSACNEEDCRTS